MLLLLFLVQSSLGSDAFFRPPQTYYPGGYDSTSIAVGDVNHDGKPDLVTAIQCLDFECTRGGVGVLIGNGDGTFQRVRTYDSGGEEAYSIAIGDVNRDGLPDLLAANLSVTRENYRGLAAVLLGNGDGTFQAAQTYDTGGYFAVMIATEDVNRDGNLDFLVANSCSSVENCENGVLGVILGNGDGTFQPVEIYRSGNYAATSIALGDVNLDGKPDLLVSNYCGKPCRGASVLLGNGDGTFQQAQTYDSGGDSAFSIAVEDVNGDRKLDLIVANLFVSDNKRDHGVVGVLLGNGDGTFQAAERHNSGGYQPYSMAVGDVNGDGRPDVVAGNYCFNQRDCSTGGVGILLGNGDGTFNAARRYRSGGDAVQSIAVEDLNGDAKQDLLVGHQTGGISVLLTRYITTTNLDANPSTSTYGEPVTLRATVGSDGPGTPAGTVIFKNEGQWLGKVTLIDGAGVLMTRNLPPGTRSITATYSGNSECIKSTSKAAIHTVNSAPSRTTIMSSVNPSLAGQPITFTALVSSPSTRSTGSVTFTTGTTTLGTALLSWGGKASITTSALPKGTHTIKATYSSTANIIGSAAWVRQAVN